MRTVVGLGAALTVLALCAFNPFAFSSENGEPGDVTTVTFWEYTGHAAGLVEALVDEFNQGVGREKGIIIELTNYGRNYQHNFEMAMDQGRLPDIFPNREPFVHRLMAEGRLLPIDDLPGSEPFLEKFDRSQLMTGIHQKDGKIFAVPRAVIPLKLIYNKELFVRAKLVDGQGNPTPPKTWKQFREYAMRISALAPGETFGVIFPMKGSIVGEYSFFWEYKVVRPTSSSFGKIYFDHTIGRYDFTVYKPILQLMSALKRDGSVFPGEKVISDDAARIRFGRKGNIGMYIAASWDVGVLTDQYPAKIDWGVADMPVINPNRRYKTIVIQDYGYCISQSAKEKGLDNIMAVYQYINGDQWLTRFYEEGKFHPVDPTIYWKAKRPALGRWADFSDPGKTVAVPFPDNHIKVKGPKWYQVFQMIYDGRLDIDTALEGLNNSYNDALDRAVEAGDVDLKDYIRRQLVVTVAP